jgi:hypothetical protein
VPFDTPPHEPEYHFHIAPTPRLPPVRLSVDDAPLQIISGEEEAEVADVELVQTRTVLLTHEEVLQVPSTLTKYIKLTVGDTITGFPVPTCVPPQLPEYQCHLEFNPSTPPVSVSVENDPDVIIDGDALAEVADVELTTTAALTQVVVVQAPCALTK